jgi:hypothetical protein
MSQIEESALVRDGRYAAMWHLDRGRPRMLQRVGGADLNGLVRDRPQDSIMQRLL